MIVKERTTWLRMLFAVRGSSLTDTWKRILFVFIVSIVVTIYHEYIIAHGWTHYSLTPLPFTLIGVALGIFLGFRNNESYDRFWEGRQLWGRMVNICRSFTRQVLILVDDPHDSPGQPGECTGFQREIVLRTIAYQHAFRCHLREEDPFPEIERFLSPEELVPIRRHRNVPLAILQLLGERLKCAWRKGWLHDLHYPVLEASLTEMTAIQGGCERIKSTPIPFTYTVLIHRTVGFYCVTLPFGIVDQVGIMTPVVTILIAHAFFGLDVIGDEIEDPFGRHLNDLPLEAITRSVEINLLELLGDESVPEPLRPVDGILM